MSADQLFAIVTAVWIVLTVLAFVGGAFLIAQYRSEDDLALAERLARKQIDIDEYRAKVSLIQP